MPGKTSVFVLVAALAIATTPAAMAREPALKKVGDCARTTVKQTGSRLEGMPDSGSAIEYANGLYQVSYEVDIGVSSSRPGDPVKICLTELPTGCPPNDDRGKIYKATSLRTGKSWTMPDSEHSCGGA